MCRINSLWQWSVYEEVLNLSYHGRSHCVTIGLKETSEKPSGPGALSGWIENMTVVISYADGSPISASFCVAEIFDFKALWTVAKQSLEDEVKMSKK